VVHIYEDRNFFIHVQEEIVTQQITEYLEKKNHLKHDEDTCRKIILPLLRGASFCHSKGVTHTYLSTGAIYFGNESITFPLVDSNVIKLSGFTEGELTR
jgi:serine/threonine protein kinase